MSHAGQTPQTPAPAPMQAPELPKKKKPIYKRVWFWVVVAVVVLLIFAVSSGSGNKSTSSAPKTEAATTSQQQSKTEDTAKAPETPATPDVPQEYKSALAQAKTYSEMMHMTSGEAADVRPWGTSGIKLGRFLEKSSGIARTELPFPSGCKACKAWMGRLARDQWIHGKPHTGTESGSTSIQCR